MRATTPDFATLYGPIWGEATMPAVDEVATAVLWLLSEDASYITGQNIPITGGL